MREAVASRSFDALTHVQRLPRGHARPITHCAAVVSGAHAVAEAVALEQRREAGCIFNAQVEAFDADLHSVVLEPSGERRVARLLAHGGNAQTQRSRWRLARRLAGVRRVNEHFERLVLQQEGDVDGRSNH
jgi:hypothetical protein